MNYKHIYMCIVSNARKQAELGLRPKTKSQRYKFPNQYFEFHHILPRALFPLWKGRKSNIVPLTAREHFFCHQLLTKIYPNHSMVCALWHLMYRLKYKGVKVRISSREYEKIKKQFAIEHSKQQKENPSGLGSHWYTNGKENVKAKFCPGGFKPGRCGMNQDWIKGKTYKELYGEEAAKLHSERISKAQKGVCRLTEDGRKRLSKALKDRESPTKHSIWINNGKICKMIWGEIPVGWVKGRLNLGNFGHPQTEETKRKLSEIHKKKAVRNPDM